MSDRPIIAEPTPTPEDREIPVPVPSSHPEPVPLPKKRRRDEDDDEGHEDHPQKPRRTAKGWLDDHKTGMWVLMHVLTLAGFGGYAYWVQNAWVMVFSLPGLWLVRQVVKYDKPDKNGWGTYIEAYGALGCLLIGVLTGVVGTYKPMEDKLVAEKAVVVEKKAKETAEEQKTQSEEGRKAALGTVDELKKLIPGPTEIKIDAAKYKELVEAAAKANVTTGGPTVTIATGRLVIGPDHVARTGPKGVDLKKVGGTRWVYVPAGGKAQMVENGGGLKVEDKGEKFAVTADGNILPGSEFYLLASDGQTTSNSIKIMP